MSTPIKVSYGVLIATLIVAVWLHLGTLLLAAFFSYFALRKLHAVTKRKWLSLILFVICLVGIAYAAGYFTRAAWGRCPILPIVQFHRRQHGRKKETSTCR